MENITDSQLVDLTLGLAEQINFQFQFWLSITFALITASVVARKYLSKRVRVVLALLYFPATVLITARLFSAGSSAKLFTDEILDRGITWVPSSTSFHAILQMIIIIFGTCSAIWFLYSTYSKVNES